MLIPLVTYRANAGSVFKQLQQPPILKSGEPNLTKVNVGIHADESPISTIYKLCYNGECGETGEFSDPLFGCQC
jgi:hypothetical protein